MIYTFCPACGTKLIQEERRGTAVPVCPECGIAQSQEVGLAAVICDRGRVLLERRALAEGYGRWALPGGMLEAGEELESALAREVGEETGLEVAVGPLFMARGGRFTTILFYSATPVGGDLTPSSESLEVCWIPLSEIPWDRFAFPRHAEALRAWIDSQDLEGN